MKRIVTAGVLFFLSFCSVVFCWAEGSKELMLTDGGHGSIKLVNTINQPNPPYGTRFASYNGAEEYRLNIHICDPSEKILMGFKAGFSIPIRIMPPTGTTPVYTGTLPGSGNGYILNFGQAAIGPNTIPGNAGGYTPISVSTGAVGDFRIEFDFPTVSAASVVDLFDITVVDANNVPKQGRLWSKAWNITTTNANFGFSGGFYIYTIDQIVTKVDLSGIEPYEFIFSANNRGTSATENPSTSRQSKPGYVNFPQYKIFLNDPDSKCFPSGEIGSLVGDPTLTGCPSNYCINVDVTAPGDAVLLLDLNGIPGYQPNTKDRELAKTLAKGGNCIPWDGLDGEGVAFVETGTINVNVKYVNGITNIPMFDVESNPNGFKVSYIRPTSATSKDVQLYWDDTRLLGGSTGGPCTSTPTIGCHSWNTNLANGNTVNTWWFISDSDAKLVLDLQKGIDANRSTPGRGKANDTSICASVKAVTLRGSINGFTASEWSILSENGNGNGLLANKDALTTTYTLSKQDSLSTRIRFVLSSIGGTCPPIKDTMTFHITQLPQVDAQASKTTVCQGEQVTLTAVGNATSYTWNNGVTNGIAFIPTSTTTYEVDGTTNGCTNTDTISVRVNPLPTVTANANPGTICSGETTTLTGGGALSYTWSPAGTDGVPFAPTATTLYTVTGTDANNCQDTAKVRVVVDPCLKCVKPTAVRVTSPNPTNSCVTMSASLNGEYVEPGTAPVNGTFSAVWYRKGGTVTSGDYQSVSGTGTVPVPTKSFTGLIEGDSGIYVLRVQDGTNPAESQCYLEAEVRLVVDKAPEDGAISGRNPVCEGEEETYAVSGVKSKLPLQYTWSSGTGGAALVAGSGTSARYKFSSDGTITTGGFEVEARNSCGSTTIPFSTTILLKPRGTSDTIAGPTTFCETRDTVTYSVKSQPNATSYTWFFGGHELSSKTNTVTILAAQNLWSGGTQPVVKVIPENICGKAPEILLPVRIYENPQITFAQNPLIVTYKAEGQTAPIVVTGTGLSVDVLSTVKWSPPTWLSSPDVLQPNFLAHKAEQTYDYVLMARVADSINGCTNYFPYRVINTLDVWVPNAFSPNGDGKNDVWVIEGILKYPNSVVNVFNRWGNKVYSSSNGYQVPWDGNHNGTEVPSATYYYVIDLKGSPDNTDRPVTGSLTIIH